MVCSAGLLVYTQVCEQLRFGFGLHFFHFVLWNALNVEITGTEKFIFGTRRPKANKHQTQHGPPKRVHTSRAYLKLTLTLLYNAAIRRALCFYTVFPKLMEL